MRDFFRSNPYSIRKEKRKHEKGKKLVKRIYDDRKQLQTLVQEHWSAET